MNSIFGRVVSALKRGAYAIRNTTALRLGPVLGLIGFSSSRLWADVNITSPTGGNNISADKALNLSSSDLTATLPPAAALAGGTTNLTVSFNATGNFTPTATDLTDGSATSSTSPTIAVSPAQFAPTTGGGAIPADGATTGTFTSLSGPSYSENASGNMGTGTIILKAPAGFVFDTGGTAPTVLSTAFLLFLRDLVQFLRLSAGSLKPAVNRGKFSTRFWSNSCG